ncbi:MAG: HlyD family secretion protein [Alphaproteobacteria bacterium]|nr:HlyD family secretion protein [Alphaproteobacteria bacterium]
MKTSRLVLIVAALALVAGGGFYAYDHRYEESTDDATIDGTIVTISPKISGYVKTLNITDNQRVKAGDVLLEIDPADYIVRRDRAQAALAAAEAAEAAGQNNARTTSVSAPSDLDAARAQVAAAQANWVKAASDLKRMQALSNEARSQQQLDQAIAAEKSARSALEDAQAKLRSAQTAPETVARAEATSRQLAAQVKQAQADLAQAEIDLADTKVVAPIDGYITKRSVDQGTYVQAGQALGSLVGTDMWVTANFKETQLTHMHRGQPVSIDVDAYPGVTIKGKVDSIQAGTGAFFSTFPPENATGNFVKIVQRVPVKITFDGALPPDVKLGPGLSVEPTVDTSDDASGDIAAMQDDPPAPQPATAANSDVIPPPPAAAPVDAPANSAPSAAAPAVPATPTNAVQK